MRTRVVLVAVAAIGAALASAAPASAAPGDCLVLAGNLVCEPYPAPDVPPLYSVCTRIADAANGTLVRRSCQTFRTIDDVAVGDPQVFTYPPENTLQPPTYAPVPPHPAYTAPAPAPVVRPVEASSAPARTSPAPAPAAPVEAVPSPATTSTPARIDAAPRPRPDGPPAAPARDWRDTVDAAVPWAAGIAALVLVFCLAYRRRNS